MRQLSKTILERYEFAAAILLTLLLIAGHVIFFFGAGPLWRDEISSLALATRPTLAELWKSLPLDPFPASYFLLLRSWNAIGLGNGDLPVRGLGLVIGLSLIAALWWSCYLIDKSVPLWPLALFGFSPLALEGGDSLRPYGFGLIWIVLAFASFWRIAWSGSRIGSRTSAVIFAVLSVQSLFTNAFMILALSGGAILVLSMGKPRSRLALVIVVGLIAAVTLLPYVPVLRVTGDWSKIIANKNDVASVGAVALDAIADAGLPAYWIWLSLSCALLIAFLISLWPKLATALGLDRERAIFAGTTLLVAGSATIGFLIVARYLVYPRYFLPAMAVTALCLHLFWRALPNRILIRSISLILGLFVAATSLPGLYARANLRMTNCDQIASGVEQRAGSEDLVIVTSFLYGVSFQRYYHGKTGWVAMPQLADLSLHRWDLLKEAIARPDPVPQLVSRAEPVLRGGHKVFLVGKLGPPPAEQPEPFPPAPKTKFGWQMEAYLAQWQSEVAYWIEHHALHGTELTPAEKQSVNPLERLGLFEVSGWRER
jgi:hypothetical protein